ncbi:Inter-alpha-trypsin inhibitor heavy chain H3 [Labeo rohita]|uniref:Inter-alpha-trypsin inhibitor heavy chain H3 n=1 Tax=Labeo rohita TaxID=84645 RepID=A0ABQ8MAG6_LABRO|nr:Inter-alpha-trypsin inhibitor heavy chain H3 [Labeo rohita]
MSAVKVMLWMGLCICVILTAKAQDVITIKDQNGNPKQIEVQSTRVECKVASRFAHTVMTTKALNRANASQEVLFEVDLPKTAFITSFSIEIEGRIYVSEVREKEQARQQYESAVSSGQTAGLVKASGRNMEKFSVSVNIAPQSRVTFTLTYEELLKRRLGSYEIMIGVQPKQLVQNFEIVVDIYEPNGIAFVDVNSTFITNELLPLVEKTVTDKKAHVYFSPTLDQQKKCSACEETLIDGDLIIKYDVNHPQDIGEIQIVNGYFVHFFAPDDLPQMPKNVTREALMTILSELYEDDYFGLVTFDDTIESWKPFLSKATPENVTAAKEFVQTIEARHLTDINKGLMYAVEMLASEKSDFFPDMSMIILLTDGRPSAGEQDLSKIQENVRSAINGSMSLFCLGFGYDVDYGLLDTLAKQNDGLARRVYEASDAVLQLQIVVAGRLQELETDTIQTQVSAHGLEDQFVIRGLAITEEWDSAFPDQEYVFGDFTERLWAYLTIQQLLDKRETSSPEDKENITAEALDLSLRYNFVTPLTSMVREDITEPDVSALYVQPQLSVSRCRGQGLKADELSSSYFVDGDPHFIIELPDQNDALCFNIDEKPGTIFNLVRDPLTGIVVNGQIIGDKKVIPGSKMHTYFGRFGIVHEKFGIRLMVSTKEISVSEDGKQVDFSWTNNKTLNGLNMDLQVIKDRSLTVTLKNSVKFLIILHKIWEKHPYHQDYLGFYTLDSHLFSNNVHGLLGQFYHGVKFEVSDLFPGKDPDKQDANMFVKGHKLTVTRGWKRDFRQDVKNGENVPCWFIHNNGTGLLDGVHTDYIVSRSFESLFISKGTEQWKRSVSSAEIEVQSVKVDCKVTSRFAHTVMTTKALNKANVSQEVSFEVELPKTSFITNFSMEIDGKTYTGVVKEKEKAKEQYQKAGIAFVDAYGTFMTNELLPLVEKTVTDKKAHVSFSPTLDQQRKCTECDGTLIDGDFFIKYDVNRPHDIGDIQIVNGYFVHFFAPANLPRVPKMVVFVIDNSYSMVGNKMAQTKEALVTILGELPEEDYFAIIVFSGYFVVWRPHLSKATQENVKAAQEYVKTIQVFGGTELHNAVIHGVEMLYEERRNGTAPKNMVMMIILLTDGEPNKYPRSLPEIQESIRNANDGNITIFSLAFGNDANYGFLDTLSKQNNGLVRRIYEDSDAPLQLAVVKLGQNIDSL